MTKSDEIREVMEEKNEQLPGDWTTSIGEGHGGGGYTHWYYHPDYEIESYHDAGHPYFVNLYEVEGEDEYGDLRISEYPKRSGRFDTEEEAQAFAIELMREHS